MSRGPLFDSDYKPQFSGHETFPLRYGWLKKAYDAVQKAENGQDNKWVFLADDAIARFGVGKNMVASIRHWAGVTCIIEEEDRRFQGTKLGQMLFDKDGLDPFMEYPATLWLIHWRLAGNSDKTTWFWSFNHYASPTFERDRLVDGLVKLSEAQNWLRVAPTTVRRDVECFVRTYVSKSSSAKEAYEDNLESPLVELSLLKPLGKKDGFQFMRGEKPSLSDGVFIFALIEFWKSFTSARTLSFEAIAHEPGSPGKVFLLDENSLAERLIRLEALTSGLLRWSETAGLKQVIFERALQDDDHYIFLRRDYEKDFESEVA